MGLQSYKRWIFGYKLPLTSTAAIDEIIIPLTTAVTTTNVPDNMMYYSFNIFSLSVFSLPYVMYIIADHGYDDKNLY
jgi:hypothetical protein